MKKLPPSSCKLVDGEYEIQLFRGNQTIISATFPSLHLTAEQVLKVEQKIGYVTLVVADYDEAIEYFTTKLKFKLIENTPIEGKRWVLIAPPGQNETAIVLAQAKNPEERKHVGNQTGGRVFLFLHTDNFYRDYHEMKSKGVDFVEEPRHESYGIVAVFKDLYGNKWDLLELKPAF
ncbi:MAG: VOC family protein [Pseudanabaenales cyanobacterium]|nr:VOC family protein [Pseudanabaenales cyanobacterium]